jgi:ABC-type antimicrobial peptide transport system permease subunit
MERYREIGILKSLGWKDSSLSIQIVATSLIQALTGSLSGIITGLVIAFLSGLNGTRILNSFEFIIQPAWIPVIILLCLGGAVIATIMPVIRLYRTEAGEMINSYN